MNYVTFVDDAVVELCHSCLASRTPFPMS